MKALFYALGQAVFNSYDVLMLVIFVESVLFSIFYWLHSRVLISFYGGVAEESTEKLQRRRHSAMLMAFFLLLVGLSEIVFLLTYNIFLSDWVRNTVGAWFFVAITLIFFLPGAMLFRYVSTLLDRNAAQNRFFLTPLVVFVTSILVAYSGLWEMILQPVFWEPYIFVASVAFALNTVFALLTLRFLHRYQQQVQDYFGNIDAVDVRWLTVVTSGFCVIWSMALIPPFMSEEKLPILRELIIHLPSVLQIVLLTAAVLFGLSQGVRIIQVLPEKLFAQQSDAVAESSQEPQVSEALLIQLRTLMEGDYWYRRPDITLDQFANAAGQSPKLVSHAINRHFEKNFYEFVNAYRIEEIKQRLKEEEPNQVSIQSIYEAAGFRSKSSFNTLFRKWVGMTPSQYRKKFGRATNPLIPLAK
ncbi:hypothetical protein Mag101_00700 [Microbulbifer agarilyticus]|uniref:HTH araC/xylS-type domain-containing protein n=1 Tax=Microbulbifer agarilyticus TaxID=260552 RepID=A0A1Q2M274_9GAMM|nr:AraC family transcriptional regulator [Microbulbifer agarilyticus]AQQ66332.1 hypothetical protein Mag101_00700 [Microbulbifer agarilyticus]